MSRFPKFPREGPWDGFPRGLRLVVVPEVTPVGRCEFGFGKALVVSLCGVAVLALALTRWVLPTVEVPRSKEPMILTLPSGEIRIEMEELGHR